MSIVPVNDLDYLAERILELMESFRANVNKTLLGFKWLVGKEIFVSRVGQEDNTYRLLEEKTSISHTELHRCVHFYEKFPNEEYPEISWRKIIKELQALPEKPVPILTGSARLLFGDLAEKGLELKSESIDFIITDPPYGKKYLPLYKDLAELAFRCLKPDGSLLTMTGQSYLPEVFDMLRPRLTYNWTVAYLTPGGQSAQLWERKVNTFWKPVLWFVKREYEGDWVGDVARSKVNDNEKNLSEWQQSESGITDLVQRFTKPGSTILDPFMGTGTIGVVAQRLGRMFIGIENNPTMFGIASRRMAGEPVN